MSQGISRKLFPGKFHEHLPINGRSSEEEFDSNNIPALQLDGSQTETRSKAIKNKRTILQRVPGICFILVNRLKPCDWLQ